MPKKLTKDQKYNRKRRKDGNKDFRRVSTGEHFDGVRVTRKQIAFYISNEASERLQQMADDAEIFKWEMASRMILKGLPGIFASGYASPRNPEAIMEGVEETHSPSPEDDERNREYLIRRAALGDNPTQEEMDAVVAYGLEQHRINFPHFYQ